MNGKEKTTLDNRPFIYTGNTTRLHAVFEKAERGEPLSFVFLGASITLGYLIEKQHQFQDIIRQYFQDKYKNPEITCHNLSMPGMSSLHGLYLSYFELKKYSPDLIVIDYSVNDQKNQACREAFESLLVKCLKLPSEPAVISFFVKRLAGYTCAPQMISACEYYNIPYVNVGTMLDNDIKQGKIRWKDFSYDDCHPGPVGHNYIGKCLIRLLEQTARSTATTECFPEKGFYNNSLSSLTFHVFDWKNSNSIHRSPLVLDVICSTLFVAYDVDTTPEWGNVCIELDGKELRSLSSYRIHEWSHPTQEIIYLSREKSPHHITLQMQPGDESKNFNLLCLGTC